MKMPPDPPLIGMRDRPLLHQIGVARDHMLTVARARRLRFRLQLQEFAQAAHPSQANRLALPLRHFHLAGGDAAPLDELGKFPQH